MFDDVGGAPRDRIRCANDRPVERAREYVLYWMISARRSHSSFALDRAVAWATKLERPLLVFEALRVAYPHASDRLHRFVLDGMRDNAAAFADARIHYFPYVEPRAGEGRGLLTALARHACVVVTDEFPCSFLPRMVHAAARKIDVRLEVVDGNGLMPLAASPRAWPSAAHFRRHVQKLLPSLIDVTPRTSHAELRLPTLARVPKEVLRRWPAASAKLFDADAAALEALPIDHEVGVVPMRGGSVAARARLRSFVRTHLDRYHELHSEVDDHATSGMSPYLHFGHVSAHEILAAVSRHQEWSADKLPAKATGAREGWWRMSRGAEAFLDQLVVWRELAYNGTARIDHYERFASLPSWAQETLRAHARDPRPHRYSRADLEAARTHDEVWNTAQRQLLAEGWFHNYLRMLWGKKILEWSPTPQAALETMIAIMDRWSLDGRDPNSYAGYAWVLGRYDRPWPERPMFGKVRAMSSERTVKKVRVAHTMEKYADAAWPMRRARTER
jgi:deoxyribodipyrimidine photo-lyase